MKYFVRIILLFVLLVSLSSDSKAQDLEKLYNIVDYNLVDTDNPVARKMQLRRAEILDERFMVKNKRLAKHLTARIVSISLNIGMLLSADRNYNSAESELRYCLQEDPRNGEAMLYLSISIFHNKSKLSSSRLFECLRLFKASRGNFSDKDYLRLLKVYENLVFMALTDYIDKGIEISNNNEDEFAK